MVMTGDCFRQVPVGCRSPSPEQQLGGHGVATDAQVVTSCDSKEEEEEEEEGAKYQADTRAVPSSSAAAGRGGAGGTLLPAAATAAAEGSLAGFLPVTTDQAKQRRALHRLLIELQLPLEAQLTMWYAWGLGRPPAPLADDSNTLYQAIQGVCNCHTRKQVARMLQRFLAAQGEASARGRAEAAQLQELLVAAARAAGVSAQSCQQPLPYEAAAAPAGASIYHSSCAVDEAAILEGQVHQGQSAHPASCSRVRGRPADDSSGEGRGKRQRMSQEQAVVVDGSEREVQAAGTGLVASAAAAGGGGGGVGAGPLALLWAAAVAGAAATAAGTAAAAGQAAPAAAAAAGGGGWMDAILPSTVKDPAEQLYRLRRLMSIVQLRGETRLALYVGWHLGWVPDLNPAVVAAAAAKTAAAKAALKEVKKAMAAGQALEEVAEMLAGAEAAVDAAKAAAEPGAQVDGLYQYMRDICRRYTPSEVAFYLELVSETWDAVTTLQGPASDTLPSSDGGPDSGSCVCLPGSALLRIFQLLCDSCPPTAPGTCWLAPVCKQWRGIAGSVKGLRVVLCSQDVHQVHSFCCWLRRHVYQVKALAITSGCAADRLVEELVVIAAGAAAAAAAAAGMEGRPGDVELVEVAAAAGMLAAPGNPVPGGPLPLQRLVIPGGCMLFPGCGLDTLRPLWGVLPHLKHLHLPLWTSDGNASAGWVADTAVAALAPLQHSTSLTSLVLDGPWRPSSCGGKGPGKKLIELVGILPTTLRSLSWTLYELQDPSQLSFDRLTGLTHLCLRYTPAARLGATHAQLPDDTFSALKQLRQLELFGIHSSNELLLAHQEQLVGLAPYTEGPGAAAAAAAGGGGGGGGGAVAAAAAAGGGGVGALEEAAAAAAAAAGGGGGGGALEEAAAAAAAAGGGGGGGGAVAAAAAGGGGGGGGGAVAAAAAAGVLGKLTHLASLDLGHSGRATRHVLPQAPLQLQELCVPMIDRYNRTTWGSSMTWGLRDYRGLSGLRRLSLVAHGTQEGYDTRLSVLQQMQQLRQLEVVFRDWWDDCPVYSASWARALTGLVNLEVLQVPAVLTTCGPPGWLSNLSRLVVLEVSRIETRTDMWVAATHISQLLTPESAGSSSGAGGGEDGSSTGADGGSGMGGIDSSGGSGTEWPSQAQRVRLVCFAGGCNEHSTQLYRAVAAAAPVLPPHHHLFLGTWKQLQECGVELWPAPVAARLQQLVIKHGGT